MKLQFKEQLFQLQAVKSVVDCFERKLLKTNHLRRIVWLLKSGWSLEQNEGVGDKGHYFESDVYNLGNDEKGDIKNIDNAKQVIEYRSKDAVDKGVIPTLPK